MKGGCCFETEFAKGNIVTSAPTTTFLVGALVKYTYLFRHKEIEKYTPKVYLSTTWKPTSSAAASTTSTGLKITPVFHSEAVCFVFLSPDFPVRVCVCI